ncbi:MAG: cytidylate kinase family protein, partial [Oscillospiraceae bacterium]|nr:cytidylate kinase family protein [Oscillospiraceae bacterium]
AVFTAALFLLFYHISVVLKSSRISSLRIKGVFIRCNNEEEKRDRIIKDYGIQREMVESTRKRFDKKRANYYHVNTGKKWDDFRNYDVILDSGVLRINGCVAALKGLL